MGLIVFWVLVTGVVVFLLTPALRRRWPARRRSGNQESRPMRRVKIEEEQKDSDR